MLVGAIDGVAPSLPQLNRAQKVGDTKVGKVEACLRKIGVTCSVEPCSTCFWPQGIFSKLSYTGLYFSSSLRLWVQLCEKSWFLANFAARWGRSAMIDAVANAWSAVSFLDNFTKVTRDLRDPEILEVMPGLQPGVAAVYLDEWLQGKMFPNFKPQLPKNIRFVNLVVKCLLEFKHAIRRLGIDFQSGSRTFRINYDIFCIQKVWMVLQSLRDFGMVMIQDILEILQENLDIARRFYYPVIWRWTEPSFPGGTFCYSWTSGGFQWLFWTGSQAVHLNSHLDWSAKNCMWIYRLIFGAWDCTSFLNPSFLRIRIPCCSFIDGTAQLKGYRILRSLHNYRSLQPPVDFIVESQSNPS